MPDQEQVFVKKLRAAWPNKSRSVNTALTLADQAVSSVPSSSQLRCMRGDILLLMAIDGNDTERVWTAFREFHEAVRLKADSVEAWESIAFCYDVHLGMPQLAEAAFREAIRLGGTAQAYAGLARLLAEVGRREEAIRLIGSAACPFHADPIVVKRRTELAEGDWKPTP